jgi:hypothetical protein
MLAATYTPGCFEEFVDLVVPELQRRGRLRTEYRYSTLRENLLEDDMVPLLRGKSSTLMTRKRQLGKRDLSAETSPPR